MANGHSALTRKPKQSITITTKHGETVTVQLYRIDGQNATLAVQTPDGAKVCRSELMTAHGTSSRF